MNNRLKLVAIVYTIAMTTVAFRLFYWQILKGPDLAYAGRIQHQSGEQILAARGSIFASDDTWLVTSIDKYLLFAEPRDIDQSINRSIANQLAVLLASDNEEDLLPRALKYERLLGNTDKAWVPLESGVSGELKDNIAALDIKGLGFQLEEDRYYPEGSSSAQLLGFVGKDENGEPIGYFGLEGYYDLILQGKPGFKLRESNPLGVPLLFGRFKEAQPEQGVDLVLHLDKAIQFKIEQHLKDGIEKYGAVSGNIIIMNPEDGGILAMASYPSFDPREYTKYSDNLFKNPIISNVFEPGSVFKPIIMASGIDAGVVEADTKCDICGEPLKIDKYYIRTWDNKYHADSTMTEVLVNSDNVGMSFVAQKMEIDKMYDYLEKFGFGAETGVDLQGEISATLRDRDNWSSVDLVTASFGQGIAVTPIQLINAITTIARDGKSITPQVVDKLVINNQVEDLEPKEGEQVISEKSAHEIQEMMERAAQHGEAQWAIPRGFRIAGKTGTAQIPVQGHYDEEKTIASFVGFAPVENPKFVMLVTLREPESSHWASETAAPLWFTIAKDLFVYLNIQPEY